jgi:trimeric autotransporter adhesin
VFVDLGLAGPYGIARDAASGTLYVSDSGTNQIKRYASGSTDSQVVAGNGTAGISNMLLTDPKGIYYHLSSSSLIIANYNSHTVVRWTIGASSWTLVAGDVNGISGGSSTTLANPTAVTLDSYGNVYVADSINHRVQFFLAGQTVGQTIAGETGVAGISTTLLNLPFTVALDSQGNL